MKVPPHYLFGHFPVLKNTKNDNFSSLQNPHALKKDTVSFSSTAKYLKKYTTLPDEIKEVLSPKDAVDMFKDIELVAQGKQERKKVGSGNFSSVHEIPWLKDYYLIVLRDPSQKCQIIYSNISLSIWSDEDNDCIQIIKKTA